jgi:hypothetical protein
LGALTVSDVRIAELIIIVILRYFVPIFEEPQTSVDKILGPQNVSDVAFIKNNIELG